MTDLAIRYKNYNTTVHVYLGVYQAILNVSTDSIQLIQLLSAYGAVTWSGIDKMNDEHLKLLGYEVVLVYLQPIPKRSNALL